MTARNSFAGRGSSATPMAQTRLRGGNWRRLEALLDLMHARARAGDAAFAEAIARGDSDIYVNDLQYLGRLGQRLRLALI